MEQRTTPECIDQICQYATLQGPTQKNRANIATCSNERAARGQYGIACCIGTTIIPTDIGASTPFDGTFSKAQMYNCPYRSPQ